MQKCLGRIDSGWALGKHIFETPMREQPVVRVFVTTPKHGMCGPDFRDLEPPVEHSLWNRHPLKPFSQFLRLLLLFWRSAMSYRLQLRLRHILLLLGLLCASQETRPPRSNQPSLLALTCLPRDGRSLANMLMIASAMRMIHRIHSHTSCFGPTISLDRKLVLCSRGLEKGLIRAPASRNYPHHTAHGVGQHFLCATRELHACFARVEVMAYYCDVVSRGTAKGTAVGIFAFEVCDHRSFREGGERKDVAYGQSCTLAGVDEL